MNDVDNPALKLKDLTLSNGWIVKEIFNPGTPSTGGFFSVGYIVESPEGKQAFLKALDFSKGFQSNNQTTAMLSMLKAFEFEREILNKCKEGKLKRVVVPLFDGQIKVPGAIGIWTEVSYIAFDLADGNIRNIKSKLVNLDLAWALRTLHYTAVGLNQLHHNNIIHQDLKPSNVLDFGKEGSKVGDLGRSHGIDLESPHQHIPFAGDTTYAPPEVVYGYREVDLILYKRRAELYLLGSLVYFMFSNSSARTALFDSISADQSLNNNLKNDFQKDLPYLKSAFAQSLILLNEDISLLAPNSASEIIALVKELCEPDPVKRGWPTFPDGDPSRYDLTRYVSKISTLAKKAEFNLL